MNLKVLITVGLLAFVGVSLATMAVREAPSGAPLSSVAEKSSDTPPQPVLNSKETAHFVAAYFHGDMRCRTCKAIELQSHEAITSGFADQLKAGDLEWRLVNFDKEENTHFREDFQLAAQSLVLIEERAGKVVRWKNLSDVWTKIHEDPKTFEQYVVENTSGFLIGDAS